MNCPGRRLFLIESFKYIAFQKRKKEKEREKEIKLYIFISFSFSPGMEYIKCI